MRSINDYKLELFFIADYNIIYQLVIITGRANEHANK